MAEVSTAVAVDTRTDSASQLDLARSSPHLLAEVTSVGPYKAKKNRKQWFSVKITKWVKDRKRVLTSRRPERISMWRSNAGDTAQASKPRSQRSEIVPVTPQYRVESPRASRQVKATSVPPPAPEKPGKPFRKQRGEGQRRRGLSGVEGEGKGKNLSSQLKMLRFDSTCSGESGGQDSSLTIGEALPGDGSFFSSSSSDADIIRTLYEMDGQECNDSDDSTVSEGTLNPSRDEGST